MQNEQTNPVPPSFEAFVPEIYLPRLQLFVRLLMGTLSAVYFNFLPVPLLILSLTQINLIIVCYGTFHLLWWRYYRRHGASRIMIRLGAWVDILGAFTAALCDPFTIPPMILLFLIAVLGNGIQHGLFVIVESMIGALLLGGGALVLHSRLLGDVPPYNLYFYVFLIVVGVYYAYVLVRRIERMKIEAIRIGESDSLTGLRNRRAFLKTAEYLLLLNERSDLSLVFVFADLDNFKAVNDTHGHERGDEVLRRFADTTRSIFRKSDILARYGGDEFVMILTNTSLAAAESAVRRLQSDFGAWARNSGMQTGVSVGLAIAAKGKNNLEDILRRADAELYEAKQKMRPGARALPPS
ncbi:MAG TPA: GGDEF domain-containing protein [Syntrophales bacterium]|nr:GGDEF domain-containing protein [Syntrophales bacterium]